MNKLLVTVIVVFALIAAIAIAYFAYRALRKRKDPAYAEKLKRNAEYRTAVAPSKTALKKAQREYDDRVSEKQDAVRDAENRYNKAIKAQEKEIRSIEEQYSSSVGSFIGIRLYHDRVEYKGKSIRLTPEVTARVVMSEEVVSSIQTARTETIPMSSGKVVTPEVVDVGIVEQTSEQTTPATEVYPGNPAPGSPADLVGTDAGAVPIVDTDNAGDSRGKAKADDEVLKPSAAVNDSHAHVLIEGAGAASNRIQVGIDEEDVDEAKSFATTVNAAAADSDKLRNQRDKLLAEAQGRLKAIKADTAAIEAAMADHKAEVENRADLMKAQEEFDLAKYEAEKKRKGLS